MFRGPKPIASLRVDPALASRAEELADELMKAHPLKERPIIVWRPFRVAAGKADFRANAIFLSAIVLTDLERLESTFKHEYAHLLAHQRHGRAGMNHGPAWRRAMADLGEKPDVYHRYDVERNASRQNVVYRCGTCGEEFGLKRRLNRRRRYFHASCGGALQLVRIERK